MNIKSITAGQGATELMGNNNNVLAADSQDNAAIALNVAVAAGEKALISAIIVSTNGLTTQQQVSVKQGGSELFTFWTGESEIAFGVPIDFGSGNDVDVDISASGSAGEVIDAAIIGKIVKS